MDRGLEVAFTRYMRTLTADYAATDVQIPPQAAVPTQSALVVVQRAWSEWRTALVRVNDLEDVHWFRPAGAVRPLIHGYVWCDKIVSGRLSFDCSKSPCPHRVLVCLLRSHTTGCVFDELARRANAADGLIRE
jgi:hypothetical protein